LHDVAARTRDERAGPLELQRLYAEHGAFVHALVKRLLGPCGDAEDLTQEVFIIALRKLARFTGSSPQAWLAQIALRQVRNARRVFRLRRALGRTLAPDLVEWRTPEQTAAAREVTREVYAALDALTEKQRTVFILFEMQGLSCAEIAELLDCTIAAVYTRLHHARREFAARFRLRNQDECPNENARAQAGERHG
jgi:RNA polymerase sigma-70 factor (ECF subfamily)